MSSRTDRLAATAIVAAFVLLTSAVGFEPLGADCGDAPGGGSAGQVFRCNAVGYLLLAIQLLAAAGLAVLLALMAWRSWGRRRRRRYSR